MLSAIVNCPLYRLSAIERYYCICIVENPIQVLEFSQNLLQDKLWFFEFWLDIFGLIQPNSLISLEKWRKCRNFTSLWRQNVMKLTSDKNLSTIFGILVGFPIRYDHLIFFTLDIFQIIWKNVRNLAFLAFSLIISPYKCEFG